LATQVIEIKNKQLNHFDGNYEEFLAHSAEI
jgi:ATPase subunit of ABC transporter with duplicated ATPase domains